MMMWLVGVIVGGYLIGCVHGSVLAQRLSGVNLKESGSNNAGASNATVVLGKKFGALVAAIDIGKAAVAVLFIQLIANQLSIPEDEIWLLMFVAGSAVIVGHNFPFHMNFNGGKGTASLIGMLFALDWRFGIIGLGTFILVSIITDFLVFGILMLYVALFIVSIWVATGIWPFIITTVIFLIAIMKHIENFQRIKRREEKRISAVFGKRKIK